MDLHLEFIVDQTAKYSDWLAQGLGNTKGSSEPSLLSTPSYHGEYIHIMKAQIATVENLKMIVDSDGLLSPPEESDEDDNVVEAEERCPSIVSEIA